MNSYEKKTADKQGEGHGKNRGIPQIFRGLAGSTLSLLLLASTHVPIAARLSEPKDGAVDSLDAQRKLFTNEDGIKTLVGGTNLMKNKVTGTGPGAGPGTGPGTVTGPGTGARTGTGSSFGNRAKRSELTNRDYTARLDSNTHGIEPSSVEFKYGDVIDATFKLHNDYISTDVLESLNVTNIDEWEVCLYMRMQNNDDSILCANPSITGKGEVDPDTGLLTLDYTGYVEIPGSSTTSARLEEATYGTGFDLYVQDENGLKIIGPGTFYMAKTEGMKPAQ